MNAAPKRTHPRSALSLVELLISIAIISILGAILLGAASVAGEVAREARTKALISRLHTLLMERYDSYRNVRVELKAAAEVDSLALRAELATHGGFALPSDLTADPTVQQDPRVVAMARLHGQRELMKVEMPDRWSDWVGTDRTYDLNPNNPLPSVPLTEVRSKLHVLNNIPSLTRVYHRAYQRMVDAGATVGQAMDNQGAECLYLVIMNATGDGEARALFGESDVADTDGDGALEFVDGWGNPISFLRWAPGFASDAQESVASLIRIEQREGATQVREAIENDHDPLDLFRVDNPDLTNFTAPSSYLGARAWRLTPLILSAGGDEETGIREDPEDWTTLLDPYDDVDTAAGHQTYGEQTDTETYADNLHNHSIATLGQSR